jgi:hypothetical protein
MDMLENLREQNSGYPLQGRVLDGLGREDVVTDAVPLIRTLDVGSPAMAVTSSVVDDDRAEDVAVTLRAPVTTVAGMLSSEDARPADNRLLG